MCHSHERIITFSSNHRCLQESLAGETDLIRLLVQNETFSCRASRTVLIGLCANLLLFEWNNSVRFLTVPCPKMRLYTCRHEQKRKEMDSSVRFSGKWNVLLSEGGWPCFLVHKQQSQQSSFYLMGVTMVT